MKAEDRITLAEINAELDALAEQQGIKFDSWMSPMMDTTVRTRYAKPGQACGTGVVRKLSIKQVAFIKRLMVERDTRNLVRLPGSEDIESMSLRGASDLIERLLGCPELPEAQRQEPKASDKQVSFIRSLVARKGLDLASQRPVEQLSRREASLLIDTLQRMDDAPAPAPTSAPQESDEVTEAGMYRIQDGTIYKVQVAVHGSGRLYAKRLMVEQHDGVTTANFAYESGAIRRLKASMRMTLEEAKEFGALYGTCCVCGRTLTDERSIEAGIGPVCAGRV